MDRRIRECGTMVQGEALRDAAHVLALRVRGRPAVEAAPERAGRVPRPHRPLHIQRRGGRVDDVRAGLAALSRRPAREVAADDVRADVLGRPEALEMHAPDARRLRLSRRCRSRQAVEVQPWQDSAAERHRRGRRGIAHEPPRGMRTPGRAVCVSSSTSFTKITDRFTRHH